ncbi:MAG: hypothetical protein ACO3A2_08845 [Bdellovibrionia bacterium]
MTFISTGCERLSKSTESSNLTTSIGTTNSSVPPVGQVSSTAFYLTPIFTRKIDYNLHQDGDFNKTCTISSTDSAKDIFCLLEMQEGDVFFESLALNYNIPPEMCKYVRVAPYWFYDYEPPSKSNGPEALNLSFTATNNNGSCEAPDPPNPASEVQIDNCTGAVTWCKYDYTSIGGPNCCEGTLNVALTTITSDPTTGDTITKTTTVTTTLPGKINNCIAGPGKDFAVDKFGNPVGVIYPTSGIGTNSALTLSAPYELQRSGNIYRANYFTSPSSPEAVEDIPTAIKGGPQTITTVPRNSYYEFSCLDHALDHLARIRLLIRSWDRSANFLDLSNPSSSSSSPGKETFNPDEYHDLKVWSDLSTSEYPNFQ